MEEEKNNVENSAEPTGDQAVDLQSSGDQADDAQSSAVVPNRFLAKNCGVRKKKPLQRKRLKLPHRKHGKKPRQKRRRHARRRNRSLRSCSAARRKKNTGRASVRNADRK